MADWRMEGGEVGVGVKEGGRRWWCCHDREEEEGICMIIFSRKAFVGGNGKREKLEEERVGKEEEEQECTSTARAEHDATVFRQCLVASRLFTRSFTAKYNSTQLGRNKTVDLS